MRSLHRDFHEVGNFNSLSSLRLLSERSLAAVRPWSSTLTELVASVAELAHTAPLLYRVAMGSPVVAAAVTQCSFGAAPSVLNVLPTSKVMVEGRPAANIMDNKPFVNVVPFGVCTSLANPATAGLTAAALGVLTPGPCIPAITLPWTPGAPKTMIANSPALTDDSQCNCSFGGVVTVKVAGSVQTKVS